MYSVSRTPSSVRYVDDAIARILFFFRSGIMNTTILYDPFENRHDDVAIIRLEHVGGGARTHNGLFYHADADGNRDDGHRVQQRR